MPSNLRTKIKSDIHQRLNPSWGNIFLKLCLMQFFSSFLVLAICPQFGLGFFPHSPLGHILMSWGEFACNFACGAIFLGTGTVASLIFLTQDEIRLLRLKKLSHLSLLSSLSLLSFMAFGVEFHLVLFLAWIIGAVLTSSLNLELYWLLGRKV